MSKTQPLVGMGFYSLVGFLRPAIYVILLPIYIEFFTEVEYGIYNLMIDFAAIFMILVSFKLNAAMMTHYYDYQNDRAKQLAYLRQLYSGSLYIGMLIAVLMYFAGQPLFSFIFKDEAIRFFPYGMIVVIYTMLFEANQCYLTFLKNDKNIWRFTFIMLTHVLSIVILQFIFIIVIPRGVQGALEGILLGNILVTLLILILDRQLIILKPSLRWLWPSFRFSFLLIPYLIIYWFLTRGGRFFLESYTDLETVALFGFIMVIGSVIILAVEAVINGVRPFLFEQFALSRKGSKAMISVLNAMIINIPLFFVPFIILIACHMHLLTDKLLYHRVREYIALACLLYFLMVISKLFYQQLLFAKKSMTITLLSSLAVMILIVGFVMLIPGHGIMGVLIATIIANLVLCFLFFSFAQKALYVRHDARSIIISPFLVFSVIFILQFNMTSLNLNYSQFGLLQFVLVLAIIMVLNIKNLRSYLKVFSRKGLDEGL